MDLVQQFNALIWSWSETLSALRRRVALAPLLIYAAAQLAVLAILAFFAYPPFASTVAPLIRWRLGEAALHYPTCFLALRSSFGQADVVLSVLLGAALALGGCSNSNSAPTPRADVRVIGSRGLEAGQFFRPRAVATDAAGRVFVVDRSGWIQRLGADGAPETRWRLPAWDNGTPTGITVDDGGDLWVADTHYGRILVYSPDGALVRQFGEVGEGAGQMIFPTDLALDGRGSVYVTEYGVNVRVLKFTEAGEFVAEWNPRDAATNDELLMRPMAIVWEPRRGSLLVADSCHHRLVRMSTEGEILEVIGREGIAPGEFRYPYDVALTPRGEILVCEYENARVQRLAPDGTPERVWGARGRGTGELWSPWGVTTFTDGSLLVADTDNHRLQVFAP